MYKNYFNRINVPSRKPHVIDTTRENEICLLHSAQKTFSHNCGNTRNAIQIRVLLGWGI
jgi:hypothetical protein